MAETKGSGWVDYMFPKPGQAEPSQKWAYVKKVTIDGTRRPGSFRVLSLIAGISASRRSVHRSQDGRKPRLQPATPVRVVMRKHIKLILSDGCEHLRGDIRRVKSRLDQFGSLRRECASNAGRVRRLW